MQRKEEKKKGKKEKSHWDPKYVPSKELSKVKGNTERSAGLHIIYIIYIYTSVNILFLCEIGPHSM